MSASLFIILLQIFLFESLEIFLFDSNLQCINEESDYSSSKDDAIVSVGCPSSHPTLTNCGFAVKGYSTARDGSYIRSNRCYAQNGHGGAGISARARCCKIEGSHYCYDKTGTISKDDARVQIKCNNNDFLFGCSATNSWSDFDGTFFGEVRPNLDTVKYNKDYNLVSTCSVQGSGSTTTGYARCCSGFQYPPECKMKYGSPGQTSYVSCSTGYTMVGCSSYTFWDNTAYVAIMGGGSLAGTCYAGTGNDNNNDVWASAVCCRGTAPTPAPTTTTKAPTPPTPPPTYSPFCSQCSQETQAIPTESVYMRYIYILSAFIFGILVSSLIYASNTWYKVSKNKKREYSKVYDFDSQDMESESVKN